MYTPEVMAFDVETANSQGSALNFWDTSFRVLSAAFSWLNSAGEVRNLYLEGERDIEDQLKIVQEHGIKLVVHNASYEMGVVTYRFPKIDVNIIAYDTMRLAQCYDNGGSDAKEAKPANVYEMLDALNDEQANNTGLGLEKCVSRILPSPVRGYKQPYYKWLRDHAGVKAGEEGQNLQKLPPDLFEEYNLADSDMTLKLYNFIAGEFKKSGYNWQLDHSLHMAASLRYSLAKARGIRIDRQGLDREALKLEQEITAIRGQFLTKYAAEIAQIEEDRWASKLDGYKTERGRRAAELKGMPDDLKFNPGSTTQLAELFVGKLQKPVTFWTKESKASKRSKSPDAAVRIPNPSFKAAHLHSYGDGGNILVDLKRRGIVLNQNRKMVELSASDGLWHQDLKLCGTKTGRYAGGGGLNVQGLARKEPGLLSYALPKQGYVFVSVDLSAGEPSVTSHFSGDKNYYAACFGMVGKQPYYDSNGVLQIDDIYLMGASVAPTGSATIRAAFDEGLFNSWLTDPDAVKAKLKKVRAFHKVLMLALQYGQGPKGMLHTAYDNGLPLKLADAKAFHHAYWHTLFPGVRVLGERLVAKLSRDGSLVNPFGYRMTPESSHLALNFYIQSSVSGIMKVLDEKFYALAPYALAVSVIHDELIFQVPESRLDDAKRAMDTATQSLNADLGWSVKIRTGWAVGQNLFEAK